MSEVLPIDDQPIAASFFDEGRWLTDFITPNALEVQDLYKDITAHIPTMAERLVACHQWVATQIGYRKLIRGSMTIEGHSSFQKDLWMSPSMTRRVRVANCANKAFLLTSLVRCELPPSMVRCVLGNLYNGKAGGHAWVQINYGVKEYIIESTMADVQTLIPAQVATRYEAIHLFNDVEVSMIEGRTVVEPYTACYAPWLVDYLDWSYIEGSK